MNTSDFSPPPTDSVLRRHYEQLRAAAGTPIRTPPPATRQAPPAVAPAASPSRGLRGWLGRLFGG
jgi:hypothetical protein